jgi:hypothetical protein
MDINSLHNQVASPYIDTSTYASLTITKKSSSFFKMKGTLAPRSIRSDPNVVDWQHALAPLDIPWRTENLTVLASVTHTFCHIPDVVVVVHSEGRPPSKDYPPECIRKGYRLFKKIIWPVSFIFVTVLEPCYTFPNLLTRVKAGSRAKRTRSC